MNKSILTSLLFFSLNFSINAEYKSSHQLLKAEEENFTSGSLINFKLDVFESQTEFDGMVGTSTAIVSSYKTKNVASLKEYGIVQFIKGCVFEDLEKEDGTMLRRAITREYFGKKGQPFVHNEWEIDSVDTDPVYASIKKYNSRLGGYFWTEEKLNPIFDKVKKYYYLNEKPSSPELSVTDMPSGGTVFNRSNYFNARSSSLEFKICIYKMSDIPIKTETNNTNFAKALKCFEWNSSHIYNRETDSFDKIDEIHPFCKKLN